MFWKLFKKRPWDDEDNPLVITCEQILDYIEFAHYAWLDRNEDRYFYIPTPDFAHECHRFYHDECFDHNIKRYIAEMRDCDDRAYEFVRDCNVRMDKRFEMENIYADIAVWRLAYVPDRVRHKNSRHMVNIMLWNIGGIPVVRIIEPGCFEYLKLITLSEREINSIKRGDMRR